MQAVEILERAEVSHLAIWQPFVDSRGPEEILANVDECLLDEIGFTLLIDDFDWWMLDGRAEDLRECFRTHRKLRVIVVTLDPLFENAWVDDPAEFSSIRNAQLCFTLNEVNNYCDAFDFPALKVPDMSSNDRKALWQMTSGYAGAIVIGVDRWLNPESDRREAFSLEITLYALRSVISRNYPQLVAESGTSKLGDLLSLMPRFDDVIVSELSSRLGLEGVTVYDCQILPALQLNTGGVHKGYKWKDEVWAVCQQWHTFANANRRILIEALLKIGEFARVFDQLILIGDYNNAELLLQEHFVEVSQDFAPEIQSILLLLLREDKTDLPYLRACVHLFDEHPYSEDLRIVAERFERSAKRASESDDAKQSLALSAFARLHMNDLEGAMTQACAVLQDNSAMMQCSERAIHACRIALDVLLLCGAIPSKNESAMLSQDLSSSLVGALLGGVYGDEVVEESSFFAQTQHFRVLGCRSSWVVSQLQSWEALDECFNSVDSASQKHLDIPRQVGPLVGCAELLAQGELVAAVRAAQRIPTTYLKDSAMGLVALAQGREFDLVKDVPGDIRVEHGSRIFAIASVISGACYAQTGMNRLAEKSVHDVLQCRTPVAAFALSLIPRESRALLLNVDHQLEMACTIAESVGLVGTGVTYSRELGVPKLTRTEKEVIGLLERGLSDAEISKARFVSLSTTKSQLQNLRKKLGVRGRKNIVARVGELGLLN